VPESPLRGPVEFGDPALVIDGDDAVQRGVEDRALAGLRAPLLLAEDASLLQRDDGLVFRDSEEQVLGLGGEILAL
jgi:hypothetical protein